MAEDFSTSALLDQTKTRGFIPVGSGLSSVDLLAVLTQQLRNYIPAFLKDLREEYLIAKLSIVVTGATIPVPARAVGSALRTVKWTCSDGSLRQLPRTEPERIDDYASTSNEPQAYYFEGGNLILVPAVTSGTVQVAYQQRPGKLVLPSSCCRVSVVGGSTVTVEARPNAFASTAAAAVDVVSGSPNFEAYALNVSGANWTTPTSLVLTLTAAQLAKAAVGDYVCLATETCIPQLPPELHDLLAQAAAAQIAADTGSKRKGAIDDALTKLEKQLRTTLSPRTDGSTRAIVNRSSIGRRGWW